MKRKPGGQPKEDRRVGITMTLKESVIAKLGKEVIRKEAHRYFEQIKQLSDEEIEKIANDSGAYRVEAGWFIEGFKVAIKGGKS